MTKGKSEIREFFDCHARTIKLDISLGAFPKGMFPKQQAIEPVENRCVIFIGVDMNGVVWFVFNDQDGLFHHSYIKTQIGFIAAGFKFI